MTLSATIAQDFQREIDITIKVLEAMPEDQLGWKPHDKSMSLGQLACHIAESPAWCHSMLEDELDFGASAGEWKPFESTDRAEIVTKMRAGAADFLSAIDGRDDAFMRKTWTMRNGDAVMMQEERAAAMRNIAIHHTVHHRGQLTVYLRLLDAPVPPTFGPTADFPEFG